jgi:hypothetical protein
MVGNGVADDKLIYTYVPALIEYYLGERPLLSNVETLRLDDGLVAICYEEGILKRSGWNMFLQGIPICGTIVFVGEDGEEFDDCPLSLEEFRKKRDGGEL